MRNYISYYVDKVLIAYRLGNIYTSSCVQILLHYRLHKAVRIEVDDNVSDNFWRLYLRLTF